MTNITINADPEFDHELDLGSDLQPQPQHIDIRDRMDGHNLMVLQWNGNGEDVQCVVVPFDKIKKLCDTLLVAREQFDLDRISRRGGFAPALVKAYTRADSENARRIRETWPELFGPSPEAEARPPRTLDHLSLDELKVLAELLECPPKPAQALADAYARFKARQSSGGFRVTTAAAAVEQEQP